MKNIKDLYLEEVGSLACKIWELTEKLLVEEGIVGVQDDDIFVPIFDSLEKLSRGEYRHQMD